MKRRSEHTVWLAVLVLVGLVSVPTPAVADEKAPPGFVALRDVDPTIRQEIRYAGLHNFVGRPVRGYQEPTCLLTRQAALALREAQRMLLRQGYTLKVYDCFRPQRAVNDFVAWAKRVRDDRMKAEFYPEVDKSRLFEDGYIAEKSGHSRGSTVDLTVVRLPVRPQRPYVPGERLRPCFAPVGERFPDNSVDMGTGFDCFDTRAHTDDPRVSATARENRQRLRAAMESAGFTNYPLEWWHYTLRDEPFPDTYFDFPVTRRSVR
ncbi:D-alanyl-D-alanine dipeptidase [Streptoalloteichus tenebrarius]|uniref:D-alanyl-D-alanine dipeptidase n=1 Tax=Streptoalloteichus tenebrarius (strain ATCC 17920 / DSM 40477 / JCM 4838 / CBS 697.72 / NBRC 16177 / NCIMB 11028 / NRRL B-12390 / A12253. 1 / ISP 5477) TaxID=1933 RepID=A0ABT1HLG6_STRSD|nr:M15 family metallopeptidase [Streptoalloteichus tenebrarius]MCP2256356.1 D-alanyl-D-alanine dipeptidase [Streptoalloteichus tenebrarius]BFF04697.1 M15 family metallopeptidase [Streptoalloteichus tenebrarius]